MVLVEYTHAHADSQVEQKGKRKLICRRLDG